MQTTVIQLRVLADEALPIDENDWGSERSMEATHKFWEAFEIEVGEERTAEIKALIEKENMDYDMGIHEAMDEVEPYLKIEVHNIMREGTVSEQSEAHKKVIYELAFGEEFMASKNKGSKVTYQED